MGGIGCVIPHPLSSWVDAEAAVQRRVVILVPQNAHVLLYHTSSVAGLEKSGRVRAPYMVVVSTSMTTYVGGHAASPTAEGE